MKSLTSNLWGHALRGAVALSALLGLVILQPPSEVEAAITNVWDGQNNLSDGFTFNDGDNWSLRTIPNSADTAVLFGGPALGTSFFTLMSGTTALGTMIFTNSLDVTSIFLRANSPAQDLIQLYGIGGVGIFQTFPRWVTNQPRIQIMGDQVWEIQAGGLDLRNEVDLSTHSLGINGTGTVNMQGNLVASAGPVTLTGGSILNVWSDNSTTLTGGNFVVNAGTLGLGHNQAAGAAGIQLNGPNAVLTTVGSSSIVNSSAIGGSQGRVDVRQNGFLRLNGPISTTELTKTGAGTLGLGAGGVNSFSKMTVSGGMVQVLADGGTLPLNCELVLNGGSFDLGSHSEHVNILTVEIQSPLSLTRDAVLRADTLKLHAVLDIAGYDETDHFYVGTVEGLGVETGVFFKDQGVGGHLIDAPGGFKEIVPAVPEPSTLALLAGLGGLALLWRRTARKA